MLYCVAARHVPGAVVGALEAQHEHDAIEVIHERRRRDRRGSGPRRAAAERAAEDRRCIRGFDGRRVAERRAPLVEVDPPRGRDALPEGVHYAERVAPRGRDVADAEIARLVLRFQGGDDAALDAIYRHVFADVYAYFRALLGDASDAEDATQQIMVAALTALPRFELRRDAPVRAWVFRIARHEANDQLKRRRRHVVEEPDRVALRIEASRSNAPAGSRESIADPELLAIIDRLPLSQRQVIAFRYVLDMHTSEIAVALNKTNQAIRHLESRALRFLRQRLAALGWAPAEFDGTHLPVAQFY